MEQKDYSRFLDLFAQLVKTLSLRSKAIDNPLFSRFSHIFQSFVVFFHADALGARAVLSGKVCYTLC